MSVDTKAPEEVIILQPEPVGGSLRHAGNPRAPGREQAHPVRGTHAHGQRLLEGGVAGSIDP